MADEQRADLVVIGAGKNANASLGKRFLGSTADRVIRTCLPPVLVVKRQTIAPYQQVLVAIDFSDQSLSAAQSARDIAPDVKLQLVNVVGVPLPFAQALVRTGTRQADIDQFRLARVTNARHDLAQFARDRLGISNPTLRVLEGDAGPVLAGLSRLKRTQLLCLGPNGRGVVLQTLLGSVTQQVIRQAACDILIARPRQPE